MLHLHDISVKNFLTVGDNPITIQLDKSPTTAITGKNGVGKSSLTSESLSFALFGKSFRGINKGELVNTTNKKGALAVVNFSKGQTKYKVSRGIKPDVFTIEKNGTALPEVSASDMQAILESILGFDHAMFCRSVALGYANYTPFMTMTKANRRQFVEDALGMSVFSDMNKVVKAESSAHSAVITDLNTKITKMESYIEAAEDNNKVAQKSIDEEVSAIGEQIRQIVDVVSEKKSQIESYKQKLEEIGYDENEVIELSNLITKLNSEFAAETKISNDAKNLLKFYEENSVCPTCRSEMTEEHRRSHIHDAQCDIESSGECAVGIHEKITETKLKLTKAQERQKLYNGRLSVISKLESEVASEISRAKYLKSEADRKKNSTVAIVDTTEFKTKLKSLSDDLGEALVKQEEYKIALELLKDSGIKASLIEKFLPTFNAKVNRLLEVIGFGVRVQFDSEFQETLIGRYADEFSYLSLSQGERERMNLAIIFAWGSLMNSNGADTSLLILDEIGMSALDADGVQSLFQLINSEYSEKNVFVISHNPEVVHQCRSHIKFTKKDGFARIVE